MSRLRYEILIQNDKKSYSESPSFTDYSNKLQLPFTINEKADDLYDSGIITLRKLDRKEPFPIENKVKINVYQNDRLIKNYDMQIEEDDIDSFYIGPRKYYTHTVNLIEITKRFDKMYLPDFTITNPATKSILKPFEQGQSNWNTDRRILSFNKSRKLEGEVDFLPGNVQTDTFEYSIKTELVTQPEYTKSNLSTVFASSHLNNSKIELPVIFTNSKFKLNISTFFKVNLVNEKSSTSTTNLENINSILYYYYKTEKDSDFKLLGYVTIVSDTGSITGSVINDTTRFSVENGKVYFKIGVNGDEKVQLKIEARPILTTRLGSDSAIYNVMYDYVTGSFWTDQTHSLAGFLRAFSNILEEYQIYLNSIKPNSININPNLSSLRDAISELEEYGYDIPPESDLTYIRNQILRPISNYIPQIVQRFEHSMTNINYNSPGSYFRNTPTYTPIDTVDVPLAEIHTIEYQSYSDLSGQVTLLVGNNGYKTVRDVLEKINILLSEDDRFIIDSGIEGLLSKTVPERIYTNRNVAEILFELGTLISAYPYLKSDNVLTFKPVNPEDNSLYEDKDTDENIKYNSENATNSYVSKVSNMITVPDSIRSIYSYWPSDSAFAYPNGKWENFSITPDTNQIQISNSSGLYYLKYIRVKNCLLTTRDAEGNEIANASTVVDLTNFCPEKSYYDTLYVKEEDERAMTNTHKSNCIYWTKGSNVINLDALEAQEKVSIWGDNAPERYKIQRAVLAAAQLQINPAIMKDNINTDTTTYQFQVCYIDYMNGTMRNKKFNQTDFNELISNYNQTDNNVSSEDWFNTAQINILRRGNTELSKSASIYDLNTLPKLGEIKFNDTTEKYLADSVSYIFDNNISSVNLNYTKSYNKIDPSVTISKDYRQYEIYGKEVVTRDINIERFLYLDFKKRSGTFTDHKYDFLSPFKENSRDKKPNYAVVFFKDKNKNIIKYHNMSSDGTVSEISTKGIILPLNYTSSGNTVTFQGSLLDNYTAGYYPDLSKSIPYYSIFGKQEESGARELKEARYVDDLGEAEYASFYIIEHDNNLVSNIFPSTNLTEDFIINNKIYLDYEKDIPIKKDNREKLNFVYQIHYLTHEDNLKWHPGLCKYLFYDQKNINEQFTDNNGNFSEKNRPTFYALLENISSDALLPIQIGEDGKVTEDKNKVNKIGVATVGTNNITGPNVSLLLPAITGYALVYPKTNEIIYHVDKKVLAGQSIFGETLYFNFYKNRV